VAYNPLAAGLLSGKHTNQASPVRSRAPLLPHARKANKTVAVAQAHTSSRFCDCQVAGRFLNNPNYLPRFYTDSNFAQIDALEAAIKKEGEEGGLPLPHKRGCEYHPTVMKRSMCRPYMPRRHIPLHPRRHYFDRSHLPMATARLRTEGRVWGCRACWSLEPRSPSTESCSVR
jgi:hypothetical protein